MLFNGSEGRAHVDYGRLFEVQFPVRVAHVGMDHEDSSPSPFPELLMELSRSMNSKKPFQH